MAFREHEECKVFKNGNLNIRIPKGELEEFRKDEVLYLVYLLFWLDCEFIGETYCLSNWATGHTIYNSYMDCTYIFPWDALETLDDGKTLKLIALEVEDYERELIERSA